MRPFLLTAVIVWLATGCKKDETPPSQTDHISSQSWKYDNGGVDADNNGSIDLNFPAGTFPACVLDNEISFQTNGNGIANEGATKCNTGDPQTAAFTWSFSNNETVLRISDAGLFGFSGQFEIKELSATKFTLAKDTTVAGFGQPVQLIVNLKH